MFFELEAHIYILEVLIHLVSLPVFGLFPLISLEFLEISQSGLIGTVFEVESELIEAAILGPVDLAEDELTQALYFLLNGRVDGQQAVL